MNKVYPQEHNTRPIDATHIWLDGIRWPFVGLTFRRAYYKQVDGVWYSFRYNQTWEKTNNEKEWFEKEIADGEFISLVDYDNQSS